MASLDPKTGTLGKRLAAHLLRRSTFVVTKARIEQFATMSADAAVEALFADNPLINPEGPRDRTTGLAWYSVHDAEATPNSFSPERNGMRLLQYFAYGNIKTFAYKVTLDPMMALYLDNNANHKNAPNENYAREFLELFTILKGEQIGVGNYTNYTEDDIITAAKLLTL